MIKKIVLAGDSLIPANMAVQVTPTGITVQVGPHPPNQDSVVVSPPPFSPPFFFLASFGGGGGGGGEEGCT